MLAALRGRFRGPRLGTKLAVMGLALLVVPWFSYQQLVEMERLLVQGQSQAQLLTAEGISTLFNGRDDLFNDLPLNLEDFEPLYAQPLTGNIRLDGQTEDWGASDQLQYLAFGSPEGTADADFELLLGERDDYLYVFMRIRDQSVVYRDPEYLRLDNADHIQLNFIRADGEDGRVSLVFQSSNVMTGFVMDDQWRYAASGVADNRIQGALLPSGDEVLVEFRFPLALLGSRRYFGMTFVDVDDASARDTVRRTRTLPSAGKESFDLVVLGTPEVRNIVQGLGYSGARILVIDNQARVRAEAGAIQSPVANASEPTDGLNLSALFSDIRPWLHRLLTGENFTPSTQPATSDENSAAAKVIRESLNGAPIALRNRISKEQEMILAAHPIVSAEKVIGTVVVEQDIDNILKFQRTSLEQVLLLSVLSLVAVFVALLAFAGRLAWRIGSLRQEASAAIDHYGRLRRAELKSEINAGDEIGDLSRSVSNMLEKLHQHNTFLESMPRTLRHEINNPLNTLSTSLQNLAEEFPQVDDSKYLASAKRGVNRIGSIVQNLADAANLEESLEAEELEAVDLDNFLRSYVSNCAIAHSQTRMIYAGPNEPAIAMIADFRIEQLMDKLVDNAVDFHRKGTAIRIQLDCFAETLQISVSNRGPVMNEAVLKSAFDSMVSHRGPQNRLHFGLGLYVVRVIAEHHGGVAKAVNLPDSSGVAMVVQLPVAETEARLDAIRP